MTFKLADQPIDLIVLSDKQILRSIYITVLSAVLLPPFIGGSLMVLVGFYPFPEFYLIFFSFTGVYVAVVLLTLLSQVPRLHRYIVALTKLELPIAKQRTNIMLRRTNLYLFPGIALYSIFGALSADFSLEYMGYASYTLKDHLYNQFGLIPVILITAYPIFFYFVDHLGRYLGPKGIVVTAVPLWTKLLMLGIVTPLLIDSLLLGYYYNRTGYFDVVTLVLWLSLMIVATAGTWLAWRSLAQSMAPLQSFISLNIDSVTEKASVNKLIPISLDELGVLTARFNVLIKNESLLTKELKQAELLSNAVVDSAGALVVVFDRKGCIVRFNRACENISGYSYYELKGKFLWDTVLATSDDININIQMFNEKLKNSRQLEGQVINKWRDKNGGFHLIEWSNTVILNDDGSNHHMVSVGIDITARSEAEEALRRSQKMDALGKLTGGIAHDYNNMLGVMMGYSELLINKLDNQPALKKYAEEVYRAGERGAKLTSKLLSFSKHKVSDAVKIDLNSLLLDKQHMLEKTLTARIDLVYYLENDVWPVYLDASDFEDAIINLCINGMHAIENNGKLSISTRNAKLSEADSKRLHINGDYVVVSITDTGSGIDDITKEKMFEPFFTTKGDHGTGLGLSQVYGFVERSNGVIRVESKLNNGTRFEIYFPRHEEITSNSPANDENYDESLKGNETILIVDDEPTLLDFSRVILSEQGYHCICVNNGKEALSILQTETVDLLLTDIIMPDMDGYQLASIVEDKYPSVKIQLVSGFSDDKNSNFTIDDKLHNNLLSKPFQSKTLLKIIRQLLDDNLS